LDEKKLISFLGFNTIYYELLDDSTVRAYVVQCD